MSRRLYAPALAGIPDSTKLVKHKLSELDESHEEYDASTFGGFTDYMRRKRIKLQNQDALRRSRVSSDIPAIFAGMTIHINGYTRPGRVELWNMIVEHGGVYKQYLEGKTDVTHIIATNLTKSKQQEFVRYRIARPEWIVESIAAGRVLPWTDYRVIEVGQNQRTLEQSGLPSQTTSIERRDLPKNNPGILEPRPSIVTDLHENIGPVSHLPDSFQKDSAQMEHNFKSPAIYMQSKSVRTEQMEPQIPLAKTLLPTEKDPRGRTSTRPATKTAKDPDFIQDYFRNSRLHHLSTWKANLRLKIDNRAKALQLNVIPRKQNYVMHVDFDCFFAAVSSIGRNDLAGKPCAVTHGGSNSGEIASCNYKAREYGVKNGMWMKEAVKICPEIISLPYEFQAYESASDHFYDILLGLRAAAIEAVSIDEALLDVSNLVEHLTDQDDIEVAFSKIANDVRDSVRAKTRVEVSVGIGANVLQAKLAVKKAKPAGQFYVKPIDLIDILDEFQVADLPGVGYSTANKLKDLFDVDSIKELRKISQLRLQEAFGPKTGINLTQASGGKDDTVVGEISQRKLVSIEINWGIRLDTREEVADYIRRVSEELCRKLKDVGFVSAQHILVKVMRRSKTAPIDPPKFLGHGPCDKLNTGKEIPITGDPVAVWKHSLGLLEALNIPPNELRGIGVALTKLQMTGTMPDQDRLSVADYFQTVSLPEVQHGKIVDSVEAKKAEISVPQPDKEAKKTRFHVQPTKVHEQALRIPPAQMMKGTQFVIPSQIDPEVLAELPQGIRERILSARSRTEEQGHSSDLYTIPSISQIDPADLRALPISLRHELMFNSRHKDTTSPGRKKASMMNDFVTKTPSPKKKYRLGGPRLLNTLTQANFVQRPVSRDLLPAFENVSRELVLSSSPSADIDRDVLATLPKDIRQEIVAQDRNRRLIQKRREQTKLQMLSRATLKAGQIDNVTEDKHRRTLVLPKHERTYQLGDLGAESLSSLRKYLSTWYRDEQGQAPDENDVNDFTGFLQLLVMSERDFERAEGLLRWIWILVTKESSSHSWVQFAGNLVDSVNLLMIQQGLGEFRIYDQ